MSPTLMQYQGRKWQGELRLSPGQAERIYRWFYPS